MHLTRRRFLGVAAGLALSSCGLSRNATGPDYLAWGEAGALKGMFRSPRGIAATDDEVYVVDMSGRVQVFSHDGQHVRGWTMPEIQNGTPTSLLIEPEGGLLIPDTHYSRIMEYARDGRLVNQWGTYGAGKDEFIYPTGIARGPDGALYVSEYGSDAERVHVFDRDRRFLRQWGELGEAPGQFNRAMAIAVDGAGIVFVADAGNNRVQCFTATGEFVRAIGEAGTEPGQLKFPYSIALGPNYRLLVCEYGNNRISIFGRDGSFVKCFGQPGRGPGEFAAPRGVAVAGNRVFVADTENNRIQRFSLEAVA